MTIPLLNVRNLSVEFPSDAGTVAAVDQVSFAIDQGRILGLVGESGAGKSLIGAALLDLIAPPGSYRTEAIEFDGQRLDTLGPRGMDGIRGRKISAIFQDPMTALNPLMRIGDQIVETLLVHRICPAPNAWRRSVELLAECGFPDPEHQARSFAHQLSGGLRQRAVIALAIAPEPRLVVADEPTTALDATTQVRILRLIRSIARQRGTAFLLISHDLDLVAQTADEFAVMYAGRIVESGPINLLSMSPQHPYTRGLLDSVPSILTRQMPLRQIDGSMPAPGQRPPGCAFEPRCNIRIAQCRSMRPALQTVAGQRVACWRPSS